MTRALGGSLAVIAILVALAGCQTTKDVPASPVTKGTAAPAVLERYAGVGFRMPPQVSELGCREPHIPAFRWSWACTMAYGEEKAIRIEFWREADEDRAEMRDWLTRYFFRPADRTHNPDLSFLEEGRFEVALPNGQTAEAVLGRGQHQPSGRTSHRIAILILPPSTNRAAKPMSIFFGRTRWEGPGVREAEVRSFMASMTFPES